ncbi:hypothetical protein GPX89_16625 [Nocardia sp. ET3-3]|uniref:Uncharacterized protein n=1 Tax=Nocardia terrae TaxID=2675851 RepID=A0A7K1UWU0_9NOCA|nr:hypothetical protein [Nocardia terrae]MVU78864.1 hypothetical protein [Nocardia terrae]
MRLLGLPTLTYIRAAMGAAAALVLVVTGLTAFAHVPKAHPEDSSPATPLPPVTVTLGPHFDWAPPTS